MNATNTAYDLNTFDQRTKRETKQKIVKIVDRKKRVASRKAAAKIVVGMLLFLAVFVMNIYGYVQLTETTSSVNSLQNQLDKLQNENKTLTVKYDSMVDLRDVEKMAIYDYGMNKLSKNQMEYISLSGQDKVEVANSGGGLSDVLPSTFRRLSVFFEYFG